MRAPRATRLLLPLLLACPLAGGCAGTYGYGSSSTGSTAAEDVPTSAFLQQLRDENQRKITGFPQLNPGMAEVEVRRIMGERPVSPAPNTLEYTAYIHGDTDTIFIYTLTFQNGVLRGKSFRQIPPPQAPPRTELF